MRLSCTLTTWWRLWRRIQTVGGFASVSPGEAGYLHPIWSHWTNQRRMRMLSRTMKESCMSPPTPTRQSRRTRSHWSSVKPSRSFTSCWMVGGSSGKEKTPVTSRPCTCKTPGRRRRTWRAGRTCRGRNHRRADPPSGTPRVSTTGLVGGSARTCTARTAVGTWSRRAAASHRHTRAQEKPPSPH
ncbi:hypothetical protein INR49_009589 [Caranx melampygus]|nr:hypothetical protein INR49_009589 [Caranx melampygus]